MPTYGQFCPVARAAEIFAERWTPLILRELAAGEAHHGALLRGVRGISPSVLGERLRELEHASVIERRPNPTGRGSTYHLTPGGRELTTVIDALGAWGQRWLELDREHLDAEVLMWRLYRVLDPATLPPRQVVVRFEFRGDPHPYWLVLRRGDPDVCTHDPGLDTDLIVRADLEALTRIYLGELPFRDALRAGLLAVEGPAALARELPRWIGHSAYAPHARAMRFDPLTKAFATSQR